MVVAPRHAALQNPAYRPAGVFKGERLKVLRVNAERDGNRGRSVARDLAWFFARLAVVVILFAVGVIMLATEIGASLQVAENGRLLRNNAPLLVGLLSYLALFAVSLLVSPPRLLLRIGIAAMWLVWLVRLLSYLPPG
jgi:hypothetical protein